MEENNSFFEQKSNRAVVGYAVILSVIIPAALHIFGFGVPFIFEILYGVGAFIIGWAGCRAILNWINDK